MSEILDAIRKLSDTCIMEGFGRETVTVELSQNLFDRVKISLAGMRVFPNTADAIGEELSYYGVTITKKVEG
jgi:hypothetical protein